MAEWYSNCLSGGGGGGSFFEHTVHLHVKEATSLISNGIIIPNVEHSMTQFNKRLIVNIYTFDSYLENDNLRTFKHILLFLMNFKVLST